MDLYGLSKINRAQSGFTLVEIMIVVVIIGLLAGFVLPNFKRSRDESRKNICISNLRIIASAKDQAAIELGLLETAVPTTTDICGSERIMGLIVWTLQHMSIRKK